MNKKENGITLVALVITIIVLLILAGVTISMVIGNNGILTQANTAKNDNKKASALEELQLFLADYSMGKANNENIELESFLTNKGCKVIEKDNSNSYQVSYKGYISDLDKTTLTLSNTDIDETDYSINFDDVNSINENLDTILSNKNTYINKVVRSRVAVETLANNETAKARIKEDSEWIAALEQCDYAYKEWTQPVMNGYTKTVNEGTITIAESGYNSNLTFYEWKAMDGYTGPNDSGYWFYYTAPAYWQVTFPYKIRIKSITFYNQASSEPVNRNLAEARLYTDSTKQTPIGNIFSATESWQNFTIPGITENEIITDTIYFYKTSGGAGIGELVIEADQFMF